MKTVEEFIKEIVSSEALKTELKAVKDRDGLAAFLKKHDCDDASVKEYMDYVASMDEGEIDDDQAATAAGGEIVEWKKSDGTVVKLDLPDRLPPRLDLESVMKKMLLGE